MKTEAGIGATAPAAGLGGSLQSERGLHVGLRPPEQGEDMFLLLQATSVWWSVVQPQDVQTLTLWAACPALGR